MDRSWERASPSSQVEAGRRGDEARSKQLDRRRADAGETDRRCGQCCRPPCSRHATGRPPPGTSRAAAHGRSTSHTRPLPQPAPPAGEVASNPAGTLPTSTSSSPTPAPTERGGDRAEAHREGDHQTRPLQPVTRSDPPPPPRARSRRAATVAHHAAARTSPSGAAAAAPPGPAHARRRRRSRPPRTGHPRAAEKEGPRRQPPRGALPRRLRPAARAGEGGEEERRGEPRRRPSRPRGRRRGG